MLTLDVPELKHSATARRGSAMTERDTHTLTTVQHAWESDQPFPLGFHTLDSDNGGMLCPNKSGQTGLDFRDSDRDHTSQQSGEAEVYQDEPGVELGNLIDISDFSCGDLQFEADQSALSKASLHSPRLGDLSPTEKPEAPDEINDFTLSWLFTPNLTDVVGKKSACEELNLTQEAPLEGSHALSSQGELISLSVPDSPSNIFHKDQHRGSFFVGRAPQK
ncbi:unnamed protein product [Pleuronectes platessa]|uniref:Uncharacterized protein n=1 Tax=Pleuronectes platessa TaxID=8262 RepID=A0A9N7U8P2_PLEPL|nr:unnamed protein product [Pleuronectes platessa]